MLVHHMKDSTERQEMPVVQVSATLLQYVQMTRLKTEKRLRSLDLTKKLARHIGFWGTIL